MYFKVLIEKPYRLFWETESLNGKRLNLFCSVGVRIYHVSDAGSKSRILIDNITLTGRNFLIAILTKGNDPRRLKKSRVEHGKESSLFELFQPIKFQMTGKILELMLIDIFA